MRLGEDNKYSAGIGHIHGLDGLRALAVMAVFGYHIGLGCAAGGFMGVDLFFVISGFLITGILLSQYDAAGFIDVVGFWLRRARRLLPALFLMLACVTAWALLIGPGRATLNWPELPAAMFYYSNWYLIFHEVSYFEQFGPPSPFGHLWSLAIEGQFYLLWPIALGLAFRFFKRKRVIALTAAAAIASAVAMIALYVPGSDPSRVYYGTDTRMFALLIGALAAMVSSRRRLPESLPFKKQLLLEVAGASGLIVVLLIMFKTNQYYSFTYQGGLLLFSAAAACLVAAIAHPASALGSLLEARPLKWIGECSYGIYLWHFPVILLTSPAVNTSGPTLSLSLIQIATTFALAAMSRYLVEDPVRYGVPIAPAVIFSRHRKRHGITSRAAVRISAIAFMVLLMPLAAAEESGQLFAFDHPDWAVETELAAGSPLAAKTAEAAAAAGTSETSETEPLPVSALAAETEPAAELTTETEPFPTYTEAGETEPAAELTPAAEGAGYEITVIGDSLMVGVKPYLEALVPGITVDAKKSRQMRQAQDLILDMKKAGNLKSTVVIELGTNGPFTENQLIDVLDSLENVEKVIFINARVPRHWETAVNETLEKVLAPYRNAVLIDWYSESSGHDEYFYDDGVHLRPVGAEAYCSMITDALWPVV